MVTGEVQGATCPNRIRALCVGSRTETNQKQSLEMNMKLLETGLLAATILTGAACGASTQQAGATTVARGAACERVENLEQQVARVYNLAHVRDAQPLYTQRFLARAIQPREVIGAELYVDAQPGVNQPYLQRLLSCHAAASSTAHPNDPLRADNVRAVDVRVQGHHYVIAVTGANRRAGQQIWEKSQALLQSGSHVEVQQLSAAEPAAHSL
jgi:hypothetical protein